jgi:drug/metabolite transporter (DMT)-like permease
MPSATPLAPFSLILAATTWGLIWYPYRLLEADGLSGSAASLLTYALGILPLLLLARSGGWGAPAGQWGWLLAVCLTAGWTNLSYVLAVIHGEVMRVMLLFYLAPLWTVVLARVILKEHAGPWGWVVIGLALSGAYVMLGRAEAGVSWQFPLPASGAEWLGLSSGIGFALTNVVSRRARDIAMETRALWSFIGVVLMAGAFVLVEGLPLAAIEAMPPGNWAMLAGITLALMLATLAVQYGLAHTPANKAVVILLFELVVAGISSQWLAGEMMGPREWVGGAMIVAATLFSMKLEHRHG